MSINTPDPSLVSFSELDLTSQQSMIQAWYGCMASDTGDRLHCIVLDDANKPAVDTTPDSWDDAELISSGTESHALSWYQYLNGVSIEQDHQVIGRDIAVGLFETSGLPDMNEEEVNAWCEPVKADLLEAFGSEDHSHMGRRLDAGQTDILVSECVAKIKELWRESRNTQVEESR